MKLLIGNCEFWIEVLKDPAFQVDDESRQRLLEDMVAIKTALVMKNEVDEARKGLTAVLDGYTRFEKTHGDITSAFERLIDAKIIQARGFLS